MICLPGILSQGGEKYTWSRYSQSYVLSRQSMGVKSYAQDSSAITVYEGYSINQNTGLITLNEKHNWGGGVSVGNVLYNNKEELEYDYGSVSNLEYAYENVVLTRDVSGTYPAYTYECYKITTVLNREFLDVVQSSNPTAYPENGAQGDYWYVKWSDEPITWERYAVSQTAVEGSSTRATGVYNKYLKVGTTYSIENGEFAVTTTQSLRIRTATSSITDPYTILAGGALSLQSSSQTTGATVRGPMLGKLTRIAGSSSNMYADFIPYTVGDAKGSYIDSVTSYNPYEFPDDGAQDGYWYVKIS